MTEKLIWSNNLYAMYRISDTDDCEHRIKDGIEAETITQFVYDCELCKGKIVEEFRRKRK